MIVTVTMNPSVDMAYPMESLVIDQVNRVEKVSKTAGGKGLNVTRVVHQLGGEVLATGVIGGDFGHFILNQLTEMAIPHDFSPIQEESRTSIALLHEGKQTEILEAGPTVSEAECHQFMEKFHQLLKEASVLTLSGSLPKGISDDFYAGLVEAANKEQVPVLLDTSRQALRHVLESTSKPFLIKPNLDEIQELLDKEVAISDLVEVLEDPLFASVEWVVVSLGSKGAFARHHQKNYRIEIPKVQAINPVGSGDSTIAGLAWGIEKNSSDEELLRTGMTTGILNVLEERTGCINPENFQEIYQQVKVYSC